MHTHDTPYSDTTLFSSLTSYIMLSSSCVATCMHARDITTSQVRLLASDEEPFSEEWELEVDERPAFTGLTRQDLQLEVQ